MRPLRSPLLERLHIRQGLLAAKTIILSTRENVSGLAKCPALLIKMRHRSIPTKVYNISKTITTECRCDGVEFANHY